MSRSPRDRRHRVQDVLDGDEVQDVLSGAFYVPKLETSEQTKGVLEESFLVSSRPDGTVRRQRRGRPERPDHYKVICISMYVDDLESLDQMVDELKSRGLTKASRSSLIRYALSQVNLDDVPRGL